MSYDSGLSRLLFSRRALPWGQIAFIWLAGIILIGVSAYGGAHLVSKSLSYWTSPWRPVRDVLKAYEQKLRTADSLIREQRAKGDTGRAPYIYGLLYSYPVEGYGDPYANVDSAENWVRINRRRLREEHLKYVSKTLGGLLLLTLAVVTLALLLWRSFYAAARPVAP